MKQLSRARDMPEEEAEEKNSAMKERELLRREKEKN